MENLTPRELLVPALNDYSELIDQLFESILFQVADGKQARQVMKQIVEQEVLMQALTDKAVEHLHKVKQLEHLRKRNQDMDMLLAKFTNKLEGFEQRLFNEQQDTALKPIQGGKAKTQSFSVEEAMVLAQRLSRASFAPSYYLDRDSTTQGHVAPHYFCPDAKTMQFSHLHCSLAELQLAAANPDAFLSSPPPPTSLQPKPTRLKKLAENRQKAQPVPTTVQDTHKSSSLGLTPVPPGRSLHRSSNMEDSAELLDEDALEKALDDYADLF